MDRRELFTATERAARLGIRASGQVATSAANRWRARRDGSPPAPVPAAPLALGAGTHVRLDDLPPEVAAQLRFSAAAPDSIRRLQVPPEVQQALRDLWNGVIGDLYDEIRRLRERDGDQVVTRENLERVAVRVVDRIEEGQRAMVLAGTIEPLPWESSRRHIAAAAVGVGSATMAAEIATYASFAMGAAVGAAAVIVSEAFETYVASSARTHQYRQVGRHPDPALIAMDLAVALGESTSISIPAEGEVTRSAAAWLGRMLVRKTARRMLRALIPFVGVAWNATSASRDVARVVRLPLRPPAAGEGTHPLLGGETWEQARIDLHKP